MENMLLDLPLRQNQGTIDKAGSGTSSTIEHHTRTRDSAPAGFIKDRGMMDRKQRRGFKSELLRGRTLFQEQRYAEAELALQELIKQQENRFGKSHLDTIETKSWLARVLYEQESYGKSEPIFSEIERNYHVAIPLFQEIVQAREDTVGADHASTVATKSWLGEAYHGDERFLDAEKCFQEVLNWREKRLGENHRETINSKHWLASTLLDLERYEDAQFLFEQVVRGREELLGRRNLQTIDTMNWLAQAYYEQGKYKEARLLFEEIFEAREAILGKDHRDTKSSKVWSARTIALDLENSSEETMIAKVIKAKPTENMSGQGDFCGGNSGRASNTDLLAQSFPNENGPEKQLDTYFTSGGHSSSPYSDSDIYHVAALLQHSRPKWSKTPRLYILLRTIGHLELLDGLIDADFSDYFFPVYAAGLPGNLKPEVRAKIADHQSIILTKSIDLIKGDQGRHRHFKKDEPLPFKSMGILGSGGCGQVDRVLSLTDFKEYARKMVRRHIAFRSEGLNAMKGFISEIQILKGLKHRHIVDFVGSYTDPKYVAVIMSPVASMDLSDYLRNAGPTQFAELRTFFGCLTIALQFLHDKKIRHKDIKPGNILVHEGRVLLTDFGLATDYNDSTGTTTSGMVRGLSPRYCAPEVYLQETRDSSSDIWSLGAVFIEMIVILKGLTIEYMREFFLTSGTKGAHLRTNMAAYSQLKAELKATEPFVENKALDWTEEMLQIDRNLRPTAATLAVKITSEDIDGNWGSPFCGICCREAVFDSSDSDDEVEDADFA